MKSEIFLKAMGHGQKLWPIKKRSEREREREQKNSIICCDARCYEESLESITVEKAPALNSSPQLYSSDKKNKNMKKKKRGRGESGKST